MGIRLSTLIFSRLKRKRRRRFGSTALSYLSLSLSLFYSICISVSYVNYIFLGLKYSRKRRICSSLQEPRSLWPRSSSSKAVIIGLPFMLAEHPVRIVLHLIHVRMARFLFLSFFQMAKGILDFYFPFHWENEPNFTHIKWYDKSLYCESLYNTRYDPRSSIRDLLLHIWTTTWRKNKMPKRWCEIICWLARFPSCGRRMSECNPSLLLECKQPVVEVPSSACLILQCDD